MSVFGKCGFDIVKRAAAVGLAIIWAGLWLAGDGVAAEGVWVRSRTKAGFQEQKLYSGYYALVIGCSDYENGWPPLPNPVKDARQVAKALESMGWQVDLLENPTWAKLRQALNRLVTGPGRDPDKAILVWYSGHGHTLAEADGTNLGYIVPIDAPLPDKDEFGFMEKAIDMRQIETVSKRIGSKHVLMIFDSCFSGAIFSMVRAVPSEYIEEKTSQPVRQFITAGNEDESVPDRSVFKTVFLSGIVDGYADRNQDGYVTGEELGAYLQERVVNYSRRAQHPQYGKINNPLLDKGDFVFVLPEPVKERKIEKESPPPKTEAKVAAPPPGPKIVAAKPVVGQVRLTANVTGARFELAGRSFETRQGTELAIAQVPAGVHHITARLEGYRDWKGRLEVERDKTVDLNIVMEPLVEAEPAGEAERIKALIRRQFELWNQRRVDDALKAYLPGAEISTSVGNEIRSFDLGEYRRIVWEKLKRGDKQAVFKVTIPDRIEVRGERATVWVQADLYFPSGRSRSGVLTYHLVKRDGEWRIERREMRRGRLADFLPRGSTSEAEAVRRVLKRLEECWNSHDSQELLSYYDRDARITLRLPSGLTTVDKEEFARIVPVRMTRLEERGFRITYRIPEVIEIEGDRAEVKVGLLAQSEQEEVRRGVYAFSLAKKGGRWLITRRDFIIP